MEILPWDYNLYRKIYLLTTILGMEDKCIVLMKYFSNIFYLWKVIF